MFAEERPHLQPLPLAPFRYYQYGTRTVHLERRNRGRLLRRTARLPRCEPPGEALRRELGAP
jgi:hypothetical protein